MRDINKFKVAQVEEANPMAGTIFLGGYSHLLKLVGRENLTKWAVSEKTQRTVKRKNLQITVDRSPLIIPAYSSLESMM